jgi:predicted anti-sigma-YlaC factor YlaD
MNSHLSSEEMYQWLSGEHGADVEEHFRECPACRTELLQFRSALAGFRTSLENSPVPAVRRKQSSQRLSRWVLASAALSLLVAAPVWWSARQQRAAEQAKADELLLERVQAGLSRSVPASMEPLMQLISREDQ